MKKMILSVLASVVFFSCFVSCQPQPDAASKVNSNPGAEAAAPDQKDIDVPTEDPFTLLDAFIKSGIASADEIGFIDITLSPGGTVSISDREDIQSVWDAMASAQVTQVGALDANPSTGGKVTLQFRFSDDTSATIEMSGLIYLNTTIGPFLFTEGHSEYPFVEMYGKYENS